MAFLAWQINFGKGLLVFKPGRRIFKHHPVLVFIPINGGNLALAKSIVEGCIHIGHGQPQTDKGVPVYSKHCLQAAFLDIAVHILKLRFACKRLLQFSAPFAKRVQIIGLQGVLVTGIRRSSAHADVLGGAEKNGQSGHRGKFAAQPVNNTLGPNAAF